MGIDRCLFEFVYSTTAKHPLIRQMAVGVTNLSDKFFAVIYMMVVISAIYQHNPGVVPLITGPAITLVTVTIIRRYSYRPRPFSALNCVSLINHRADSSFPSKHAACAFVIAMAIWQVDQELGGIMLAAATITGLSRIMVGVHYPSDILSGGIMGVVISLLSGILHDF